VGKDGGTISNDYRGRRQSRAAAYEARVLPGVESRAMHGPVREEFQAPKISARPSAEDASSKRTRSSKRQIQRPPFPPRMPPGSTQMAARKFSADRDTMATPHELWRK
jgi:hypothetical protein